MRAQKVDPGLGGRRYRSRRRIQTRHCCEQILRVLIPRRRENLFDIAAFALDAVISRRAAATFSFRTRFAFGSAIGLFALARCLANALLDARGLLLRIANALPFVEHALH